MKKIFLIALFLSFNANASNCVGLPPDEMFRCFSTEQKSPWTKDLPAETRLANKLGIERSAACLFISDIFIESLNSYALTQKNKINEINNEINYYKSAYNIFFEITKKQNNPLVKQYTRNEREKLKNIGPEKINAYYEKNCELPEFYEILNR